VIVISSFLGQTDVEALIDDVAAVELTIDGVLVAADRLGLADFPPVLGIRLNIPGAALAGRDSGLPIEHKNKDSR
jgi:hypothetical protein